MVDWIGEHRSSIQFAIWMVVGVGLIIVGATPIWGGREPGLLALGAGALGLPGFSAASRDS